MKNKGNEEHSIKAVPAIPLGYHHLCGNVSEGFVISDKKGNEFVWVPLENLNGPKPKGYHETFPDKFKAIIEKHKGFYVSRYDMSKEMQESGEVTPQTKKGYMPWTDIDFETALKKAANFDEKNASHLLFGMEYDAILKWLEETGKSHSELYSDSTEWGNYWNVSGSPKKVVPTGSNPKWMANNIYDLAGNIDNWTQEIYEDCYVEDCYVLRGGFCDSFCGGIAYPAGWRNYTSPEYNCGTTGFRVVILAV